MAVTPTPGQRGYVYGNRRERRANESLVSKAPGEFFLDFWAEILTMVIAPVGLIGNSAVLWLLGFRIRRNPFSIYILNLAVADALFLCCVLVFTLRKLLSSLYDSFVDSIMLIPMYAFYTVGVHLLVAISTERCLSVLFPIWYRCHRPKHTSTAVSAVLWPLGCVSEATYDIMCFFFLCPNFCHNFFIIDLVWFSLLTCVLCVSSLTLLLRVQCSSQRRQPPRLYLLVLLTVLVFLLCGLAPGIQMATKSLFTYISSEIAWLLACINSSMNPFIYFFLGSQGQKRKGTLRVLLQRALADETEMSRESRGTPCTDILETSS